MRAFVIWAIVLGAAAARAESPADRAAADTLFEDAKKLMAAGKVDQACPKLETSNKLVPRLGTTLNLAECHEKIGKTATAWAEWRQAAALAKQAKDDREGFAQGRAATLEPKLARLTIQVDPTEPAGFVAKRDGEPVEPGLFGSAIPVDPGPHTVEATAPGAKPWSQDVTVSGQAITVTIPKLAGGGAPPPPPTSPVGPPAEPAPGRTARIVGLTIGAVGLVAAGVGFGVGAAAKSTYDGAIGSCTAMFHCPPGPAARVNDAFSQANLSTALVVAGGVAVAAGVTIYLLAPRRAARRVAVIPTVGGLAVVGGF
jgi:serine/threonine-protein kinase